MRMALAALALLCCSGFVGGDEALKMDPWESWNSFKEGTTITFEMEMAGMKTKQVKTLAKKEKEEVTINVETIMKVGDQEMKTPTEEKYKKSSGAAKTAENCPLCSKPVKEHKDMGKWSDEKVKVGDKELACKKYESPEKMCNGNAMPKTTSWFCKDVPGGLVKMKSDQMTMTLTNLAVK